MNRNRLMLKIWYCFKGNTDNVKYGKVTDESPSSTSSPT